MQRGTKISTESKCIIASKEKCLPMHFFLILTSKHNRDDNNYLYASPQRFCIFSPITINQLCAEFFFRYIQRHQC